MIAMRVGVHRRPHWPTAITCTFNRSEGAHYLAHLRAEAASALRHTATPRKLYCAQPLRLAPTLFVCICFVFERSIELGHEIEISPIPLFLEKPDKFTSLANCESII